MSTYMSAFVGTVLPVAEASVFKPVFSGLIHTLLGLMLLALGGLMIYLGLAENKTVLLGLGLPFTLVGMLFSQEP